MIPRLDRGRRSAARSHRSGHRQLDQREVPLEAGEPSIEALQTIDAVTNHPPPDTEELRKLGRGLRAMAALAPVGDACRVGDRDIKATELDDETQPFGIQRAVVAIAVLTSLRPRQEPGALVEAQRVGAYPQLTCQLTDAHAATFRPPSADVKPRSPSVAAAR